MNVNYKMMGVVLCGAMLLASGCGAKAETTASSAVESESVSVVALLLVVERHVIKFMLD